MMCNYERDSKGIYISMYKEKGRHENAKMHKQINMPTRKDHFECESRRCYL